MGEFLEVFVGGAATAPNVAARAVGAMLGVMGYALGIRRLAVVAVLFFGLAASEGLISGIEGYDRGLPDQDRLLTAAGFYFRSRESGP